MKEFRGVYAIAVTPFDEKMEIDVSSLESCIEFCIRAGADGIVTPVNASEFGYLTAQERRLVVETAVRRAEGRIPVIAGVAGVRKEEAAGFVAHARAAGADGVIAMPPYLFKAREQEVFDYYQAIGQAARLPLFIQNYIEPLGTPMSPEWMLRLAGAIEQVQYIKEETAFSSHMITDILRLAKERPQSGFRGVMGGKAGRFLLDEYRRGACGSMPACEVVDLQARIWNLLEEGSEEQAAALYNRVLPLLNMESVYGPALYKAVLVRRGVIRTANARALGGKQLDEMDYLELDRLLAELEPLLLPWEGKTL